MIVTAVVALAVGMFEVPKDRRSTTISLPTSKSILLPAPGFLGRTNSFPVTIALSPGGRYAALLNQGYGTEQAGLRQSIAIIDLRNNVLRDFPDDRLRGDERSTRLSYFIGLSFSADGRHLYASMVSADQNGIAVYRFADGEVQPERFIALSSQHVAERKTVSLDSGVTPPGTAPTYPAGFAVLGSSKGDQLLIANNLSDNVVLLDVTSGRVLKSFDVSMGTHVPAAYPYTALVNREGTRAWVSLWNASAVVELDLRRGRVRRRIELWRPSDPLAPGTHPTSMLLDRREQTLYVAMSNAAVAKADGIAAVDLARGVARSCYRVALGGDDLPGAASLAIALSPDGKRLYAAAASLNAVAVFDTERHPPGSAVSIRPKGFIPTEWYPAALAVTGQDLLIASAKGESTGPNHMRTAVRTELHPDSQHPYIAALLEGAVQRLGLAQIERDLALYTRQVEESNLLHENPGKLAFAGGHNPIRHVIYILKENRTYDQILGDLGVGNGDPSLTMYGAGVTPNEHKLALQFGVVDNFYDSGDVSANGHLWSDASATSDYIEKIWPIIYRHGQRPQDPANALDEDLPLLDDPGTGFLWDNLSKHNFTYRIYGEMLDGTWCGDKKVIPAAESGPAAGCPSIDIKPGEPLPASASNPRGGPSPWPWAIPRLRLVRPTKEAQRGHIDPLYADFAIEYPDQLRADEFLREFDGFVKARGTSKELPQFIELWLPNDHTGGTRPGKPAPQASVADNDLAVGRIVDAVSHSPYWNDAAIFVVEDDAQDGADHVDAHRSTAFVISKYSPRSATPFVEHHFYTTVSMIHTMEVLIGLPPLNLFDVHAPVMAGLFTGEGNQPPYQADYQNVRNGLLYEVNARGAPGAAQSERMDFSRPDAVNAQELNAILWQDAKMRRPGVRQR